MYSYRDKILKKKDEKTSELEEEVANALLEIENSSTEEIGMSVK